MPRSAQAFDGAELTGAMSHMLDTVHTITSPGAPVEVRLGLGINTGAGIKDNSVGFKALGCGLQVGQRTGVSFFDNEITVDFKRLFGSGEEEEAAAANDGANGDDVVMRV